MMQLNLGSGADYRDGWVNLDVMLDSSHHAGPTAPPDVLADAHRLPFVDARFEQIRASHVIEHLERPLDALRECHRVCEPGGSIYVEVPDPKRTQYERDEHLYSWSRDTLRNIVERAGFEPEEYQRHTHEWPSWTGEVHHVVGRKASSGR